MAEPIHDPARTRRLREVAGAEAVGIRALIVHAIDDSARAFYLHYELEPPTSRRVWTGTSALSMRPRRGSEPVALEPLHVALREARQRLQEQLDVVVDLLGFNTR
jgi:hypothetical protein